MASHSSSGRSSLFLGKARVMAASGLDGEAADLCRMVLDLEPGCADAARLAAACLQRQGEAEAAMDLLRGALADNPGDSRLLTDLGRALCMAGDHDAAAETLDRAVAEGCRDPLCLSALGVALWHRGEFEQALCRHQEAAALAPRDSEVIINLSTALMSLGRFQEAAEALEQVVDPGTGEVLTNLGIAYKALGRLEDAKSVQRAALARDPDNQAFHWNLGVTLLLAGDHGPGWAAFDRRWSHPAPERLAQHPPLWDGAPLDGRSLMLMQEQGLGDAIQFARWAPRLKAEGARLVLQCGRPLHRLMAWTGLFEQVVDLDQDGGTDLRLSVLSLPRLLGGAPADLPPARWLDVPAEEVARWAERLPPAGLRVGLVWAGNPRHRGDRFRSLALAELLPVLKVPGVSFVSLQVGVPAAQIEALPASLRPLSLADSLEDLADTAALLGSLDLLITCDSAPAHLAGSLGRPCWVLLPAVPDWRWQLDREDTPWYPGMRLFRQQSLGDWAAVADRVAGALAELAAGTAGRGA